MKLDPETKNENASTVEEFLEQLESFISNLTSATQNMEGQVTLAENGIGHVMDGITSPSDYQAVGKK